MELLTRLTWIDMAILVLLAAGIFIGFTHGIVRYALGALAVVVAFILAAQLKGPITDALGVWTAFSPEGRELLIFALLFFGLVIGAWFLLRTVYRRTTLPIARQLDEIGGAIFGLIFVVLLISLHLVMLDSFLLATDETGGWIEPYRNALNESVIVQYLRDPVIPAVGVLIRPFVPADIAQLLFG